jgi:predicted transcriptional regulator
MGFSVISYKDFKNRIRICPFVELNHHRLSIEDVFNNENRKLIIKEILNEPGIHYNELLRRLSLKSGQLQWHLKLLKNFGVIRSERIDNFLVFRCSGEKIENKNNLVKSPTTYLIYECIKKKPGITASSIAHNLDLRRNTVKYHVDKLKEKNLIYSIQNGRRLLLHPKF